MGFFSSSRSSVLSTSSTTNRQSGIEGENNIIVEGNFQSNFDDRVKGTVDKLIDLAGSSVIQNSKASEGVLQSLQKVAERQKSPETALTPMMLIAGAVLIAFSFSGAFK
jgi:hypothetical protein